MRTIQYLILLGVILCALGGAALWNVTTADDGQQGGIVLFILRDPNGGYRWQAVEGIAIHSLHPGTRVDVNIGTGANPRVRSLYLTRFVLNAEITRVFGCRSLKPWQRSVFCGARYPVTGYWETSFQAP